MVTVKEDKKQARLSNSGAEKAYCYFCFHEGIYGQDIVDTDYRSYSGHDTIVTACKDVNTCFNRMGK